MASVQVRMEGDGLTYIGEVPREKIGAVLAFLMQEARDMPTETKQKKWHTANKKGNQMQKEIAEHSKRSRLDPKITTEVEQRLIAGDSVPVIIEKVDVSAPTVYVIKARLRKEGKLV